MRLNGKYGSSTIDHAFYIFYNTIEREIMCNVATFQWHIDICIVYILFKFKSLCPNFNLPDVSLPVLETGEFQPDNVLTVG